MSGDANPNTSLNNSSSSKDPVMNGPSAAELRRAANYPYGLVQPLLTDQYQVTMAYAYWKSDRNNASAVFDFFFRKNPFDGEFTIFAGLSECLKFLQDFEFSDSDIAYLKTTLPPSTEEGFFEYLKTLDCSNIEVYAIPEGSVVFPRMPLLRLEGPLPLLQLIETPLLTLINFASLVTTNAARFRLAAGKEKVLLEFGLRRAQGPDGGLSASRYCYMGGFNGTSNVLAGKLFGIPITGTHAHSFVMSFGGLSEVKNRMIQPADESKTPVDFVEICLRCRKKICDVINVLQEQTNEGELAAFIAYAVSFPTGFLALVDTYEVLKSGVANFLAVTLALDEVGYKAKGVRIDSGDLAYLSLCVRDIFKKVGTEFSLPWLEKLMIVASNDINEETLLSLNQQMISQTILANKTKGHGIDAYGIGTHLVTCQKQPNLGGVCKLVQINGVPRIKLSQDVSKVTIPGRKVVYRLFSSEGHALIDLMQQVDEEPPKPMERVLCRHPFEESKRAYVKAGRVEILHKLYLKNGQLCQTLPTLEEKKKLVQDSLDSLRHDHKRALNPTPYKVSVSDRLYHFLHDLWLANAPIGELY
ncbi:nicotinate phosphoribosyltransferase-like isoform X1 [Lytechinus variegatus]|uniref:nicotinate phosphoribosyltransferase-like isoform X1 n=1 Tax=Lytechinus variegatus TaxID=7654 RepID=UPI001BB2ABF1|nr:nicotinate phosphoribosyltransferase-like isoform X1 [Lytechinus variegatus]XP_041473903.1 nicotinate phosphoribosyltransferase-like isoform X1 [Lytechinus variegatus]